MKKNISLEHENKKISHNRYNFTRWCLPHLRFQAHAPIEQGLGQLNGQQPQHRLFRLVIDLVTSFSIKGSTSRVYDQIIREKDRENER